MEHEELGAMQGYLLLADISGYTKFLTGTELEHSHAIVTELTKLIRASLTPPMRFVKLEGDAVFCFADADAFPNGEQLVELTEACYFDFTSRLLDMTRSTTCECDACASISMLDLKFVSHFGTFIVDRDDDGRIDLAGPDVILVHRLLKNTVVESGGPSSYAFFSDGCLTNTSSEFSLAAHSEVYDSFGEIAGRVQDLARVAEQRRASQRVFIGSEDADLETSIEIDARPSVVWQYFVEPEKRRRAFGAIEQSVEFTPNDQGRVAAGASSHCVHSVGGDALREYLDWRPYEYFTCRFTPLPNGDELLPPSLETNEFVPVGKEQTSVRWRIRVVDRSEQSLRRFEPFAEVLREFAALGVFRDGMQAAIAEDAALMGLADLDSL